ncbi:hypothetical protein EII29_09855 [Leptotrichia sp. OH3620_COT-345]|uniref:hypothetical protein n=1 Tax=Leptotrichia sp. OH3620_COT-345 TaxID=2491048 RepID=UPI000F653742|nr:hypothetical protein [Leptotrichia sp. OH3620_COT-345]RRD38820.1 hypothetical protein EII29_09855 [Leptotrichia sp. OH3620_COT-345]
MFNLDYKIFIKFDEAIDYSNLKFLGSNSFNTVDFLSKKMGDVKFLEKAKEIMNNKFGDAMSSKLFAQANNYLQNLKEYYLFPVSPSELKFKGIGKWEKIETVNGILKLKSKNDLQAISFQSFIPEQKYNFASHHLLDPFTTFILFKSLEVSDKPVRFILIGKFGKSTLTSLVNPVDLNFLATVNRFEADFDNTGTLNFDIEFEEFQEFEDIKEEQNLKEKLYYKVE